MREEKEEVLEEVKKLVENLKLESDEGAVILVEGERDLQSLRELGIKGKIIKYRSVRDLLKWSSENPMAKLIVLTDFDKEGIKIAERVCLALSGRVGSIDTSYMKKLSIVKRFGIHELKDIKMIVEDRL